MIRAREPSSRHSARDRCSESPEPPRVLDCPLSPAMTTDGMIDLRDASHAVEAHLDGRAAFDGLVDDAVALGELEELIELLLARVGVDRKGEPDLREADRGILGDAEGAAEIEIALGRNGAGRERDRERGR